MPIKGLTDRGLAFPEIGQLRKGAKKTMPDRPGADLNYFRPTFDEAETEAAAKFHAIYGAEPNEIKIMLPFDDIPQQWAAWLEAYTAGRMIARSDGEYFIYQIDYQNGEILVKNGIDLKTGQPKPYVEGQPVGFWRNRKTNQDEPVYCKHTGRLRVILPELERVAYVTVLTTSIHDVMNIDAQLKALKALNISERYPEGRLAGIPLILRRRPKSISTPNQDGTRARRVKWLISIEADPEWVRQAIAHTTQMALPGGVEQPLLLTSGNVIDYDDDEITEATEEKEGKEENQFPSEPQPETTPPPPTTNGNGRPYAPDALLSKLKATVAANPNAECKAEDPLLAAYCIGMAWPGEPDATNRSHMVISWLFGVQHPMSLEHSEVFALLKWLEPQADSGGAYSVSTIALNEARMVYTEALRQPEDTGA